MSDETVYTYTPVDQAQLDAAIALLCSTKGFLAGCIFRSGQTEALWRRAGCAPASLDAVERSLHVSVMPSGISYQINGAARPFVVPVSGPADGAGGAVEGGVMSAGRHVKIWPPSPEPLAAARGPRRIWADGTVIYSISGDPDIPACAVRVEAPLRIDHAGRVSIDAAHGIASHLVSGPIRWETIGLVPSDRPLQKRTDRGAHETQGELALFRRALNRLAAWGRAAGRKWHGCTRRGLR